LKNDELIRSDVTTGTTALSPSKLSVKLVGFQKNNGVSITKAISI